jgi:glutamate synthase (ferredoxin)
MTGQLISRWPHGRLPGKQGLYDPQYEHDACGIGLVADLKGRKSNQIVRQALRVLVNLSHRGARGSENNSGDGAGILLQIPDAFLRSECKKLDIALPEAGSYGVGMAFLSHMPENQRRCKQILKDITQQEGQEFLGWRIVPSDGRYLGELARNSEPAVVHFFIGRQASITDDDDFERLLYLIRRRAEKEIGDHPEIDRFYVASLSHRTLVYKGMLTPEQLAEYYPDLTDPAMETALALIHSRFSTNTFPSWERAHPYRRIIHNGEINTIQGNVNWMRSRENQFASQHFGENLDSLLPIIDEAGSDSSMFDNCLEFLSLAGRSLPHSLMMMIPEPWARHQTMSEEKRAFYEYHSCLMEPWDGPAAIAFTDGRQIGAVLDRNGLRPARYTVTKDDLVVLASEVGVLDIPAGQVKFKGRLQPGRMLLVDTINGRIISDESLKHQMASAQPYRRWLDKNLIYLDTLPQASDASTEPLPAGISQASLVQRQQAFGYTFEDLRIILGPMAEKGVEPIGSMGDDTPLAILSDKPQPLFNYFKQLFAQVTNPPIDAIREELIMGTGGLLGAEDNLLEPPRAPSRRLPANSHQLARPY